MMAFDKKNLLLLFERPGEPVFTKKGEKNVIIDVPIEYVEDRYQELGMDLVNRFGDDETDRLPVKKVTLPDLSLPLSLDKSENFSLFIPLHAKMSTRLIEIFLELPTLEDFWSVTVYCRARLNQQLFNYAYSVALLHRPDTKDVSPPALSLTFPGKFLDGAIFNRIREESVVARVGERNPIEVPRDYTASDLDEEHRVAYFREDMGVNLHHWHWHLVYPGSGPREVVAKNRRGELFYYMHSQILARYNMERLCNGMARVKRLLNLREPITEAYFPKLDGMVSSRTWPARNSNTILSDIYRPVEQLNFDIEDLERWRSRVFDAIHMGFVFINRKGETKELTEQDGIDILGDILEATSLSVNRNFYGNLHNLTHMAIAYSHDPDHRNLESFSVMGDSATAMRDPVFYRVHEMVDDIFQEYKSTLPGYTTEQLDFSGVTVTGVKVQVKGEEPNKLFTHWQQNDIDLSRGMDFTPRGPVFARLTHLQHAPFTYNIEVQNSGAQRMGTVRIFVAPSNDERGLPMLLRDQKKLFVELDRFTTNLMSGKNTIVQRSDKSSVTIPFERSFRNLDEGREVDEDKFNFCGCGWPHNLLIARGTAKGYPCDLFVMVSNYAEDKVDQPVGSGECTDAMSYCGIRDKLWPDRRAMGYPFDRFPRRGVSSLETFLTGNMKVQPITISFMDRVTEPEISNNP